MRHTAATLLKSAGADIQTVKDQLGHSQIALTANTYTHWTNPTMKAASTQMQGLFDDHRKKLEKEKKKPSI